jgi:selenocysteine lyase/cysteine desulfurase
MQMSPFSDDTFIVCSANYPHWLTINSQDEIIWTKNCRSAIKFSAQSYQEMLNNNKWLDDAILWFHKVP